MIFLVFSFIIVSLRVVIGQLWKVLRFQKNLDIGEVGSGMMEHLSSFKSIT